MFVPDYHASASPELVWWNSTLQCAPLVFSDLLPHELGSLTLYPLGTALLNEHAHVTNFSPVLPVIPCSFARLPCLLRQKKKENTNTQNVARVVANAAYIRKKL